MVETMSLFVINVMQNLFPSIANRLLDVTTGKQMCIEVQIHREGLVECPHFDSDVRHHVTSRRLSGAVDDDGVPASVGSSSMVDNWYNSLSAAVSSSQPFMHIIVDTCAASAGPGLLSSTEPVVIFHDCRCRVSEGRCTDVSQNNPQDQRTAKANNVR
jgi:hypothetical protein